MKRVRNSFPHHQRAADAITDAKNQLGWKPRCPSHRRPGRCSRPSTRVRAPPGSRRPAAPARRRRRGRRTAADPHGGARAARPPRSDAARAGRGPARSRRPARTAIRDRTRSRVSSSASRQITTSSPPISRAASPRDRRARRPARDRDGTDGRSDSSSRYSRTRSSTRPPTSLSSATPEPGAFTTATFPAAAGSSSASPSAVRRAVLAGEAVLVGAHVDHVDRPRRPSIHATRRPSRCSRSPSVTTGAHSSRASRSCSHQPAADSSLGQDHHARLVHAGRRGVAERQRQLAEHERQVRLRRLDVEHVAQASRGRPPRTRCPAGIRTLVLDHAEAPVLAAHHVKAREGDPARRRGARMAGS